MGHTVFNDWLNEPRAIMKDINNFKCILCMENCSGHKIIGNVETYFNNIKTAPKFQPTNATLPCQPLDSFAIKEIKTVWRRLWEAEKNKGMLKIIIFLGRILLAN